MTAPLIAAIGTAAFWLFACVVVFCVSSPGELADLEADTAIALTIGIAGCFSHIAYTLTRLLV